MKEKQDKVLDYEKQIENYKGRIMAIEALKRPIEMEIELEMVHRANEELRVDLQKAKEKIGEVKKVNEELELKIATLRNVDEMRSNGVYEYVDYDNLEEANIEIYELNKASTEQYKTLVKTQHDNWNLKSQVKKLEKINSDLRGESVKVKKANEKLERELTDLKTVHEKRSNGVYENMYYDDLEEANIEIADLSYICSKQYKDLVDTQKNNWDLKCQIKKLEKTISDLGCESVEVKKANEELLQINEAQAEELDKARRNNDKADRIWDGELEWKRPQEDEIQTVKFTAMSSKDPQTGRPEVNLANWPVKFTMQLIPRKEIQKINQCYFLNAPSVIFHSDETSGALKRTLFNDGFAGCVYFNNCDIKVLILLYAPDIKVFVALIPNEQDLFVEILQEIRSNTEFKLTEFQVLQLQEDFKVHRYLTRYRRKQIAKKLELSEQQVSNWFKNERLKKKHEETQLEHGQEPKAAEDSNEAAQCCEQV